MPLPGDESPWPMTGGIRTDANYAQASGAYMTLRQQLLEEHAARWLLALHDYDRNFYATTLFSQCAEIADELERFESGENQDTLTDTSSVNAVSGRLCLFRHT